MTIDHDHDKQVGTSPMPPIDRVIAGLRDTGPLGELETKAEALGELYGPGARDSVYRALRRLGEQITAGRVDALTARREHQEETDRLYHELDAAQSAAAVAEAAKAGAEQILEVLCDPDRPPTPDLSAVADLLHSLTRLAELGGGRSDGNRLAQEALDRWRTRAIKGRTLTVAWSPVVVAEAVADLQELLDAAGEVGATPARRQTLQIALDALRQAEGTTTDHEVIDDGTGATIRNLPAPTDPRLDGRAFAEGIALETIHTGELVSIVTLPDAAAAGPNDAGRRAVARRARQ